MDNIGIPRDSVYYKYYQFMKVFNEKHKRYTSSNTVNNTFIRTVSNKSIRNNNQSNKTQKRRLF